MAKHAAEQHSNQTLALSLSDHSFWCYTCDDYVSTPRLEGWLRSVCESQLSGDEDEVAPKGKERIGVAPGASSPTSSESDGAEDKYGDEDGDEDEDDYVTATPESVAAMLANGEVRNIVVVAGAGISTSAVCLQWMDATPRYCTVRDQLHCVCRASRTTGRRAGCTRHCTSTASIPGSWPTPPRHVKPSHPDTRGARLCAARPSLTVPTPCPAAGV
jgi:hypothetical protein